ncbi:MAG: AAA family ATPase [Clostridiales Family XIII bacterium]|jgi:hypothetical protein|nr:AAA family ATPase [Clostridiales Family XIII bacterium]
MKQYLTIGGHAWTRRFFYTKDGRYHEFTVPGGGAMLAALFGKDAVPAALADGAKCEHIRLDEIHDKNGLRFCAGGHAGWTDGPAAARQKRLSGSGQPNACVVWDEGFGDFRIPGGLPVLWASNKVLPSEPAVDAIRGRCFLMLDVDVLRKNGAMISRQVSWEHSATDLVWQLANNPAINYLNKIDHILITFAEDGAVSLSRQEGKIVPHLVLAHGGAEGTLRDKNGGIPDTWTAMVYAAALQLSDVLKGKQAFCPARVLAFAGALMERGYEPSALASGNFKEWFAPGGDAGNRYLYRVPVFDSSLGADPYYWSIGGEVQGKKVFDVAFDYVKHGGGAIDGLPQLSFGALTTIDRREIESFQNVKNLIVEYAAGKAVRPLSIAVFGAPGSGKSFGVTQIAKNVLPGKVEKLEFNVSQFTTEEDLSRAFHKVRDCILEGKLPLVFFDEFDSDKDGRPLGWLKNFLMPMQDGIFKDGGGEHPVGKCIFVFAGGTSQGFEEFSAPLRADDTAVYQSFKNVKGPDFVSRLRGTINVLGPNPVSKDDGNYILRRALLLRSLGERKLTLKHGELAADGDVVRAMLLIPAYKHGARSMEAILDMSRMNGVSWEPASLPFYTQLSLHVDADVFIRLVLNKVRLNSFTEKLAKAIHDDFEIKQQSRGEEGPYVSAWEGLPEAIKDENRKQARAIPEKLAAVGCGCDAGDTPFPSVEVFTDEEILTLSVMEHERWMGSKAALGYTAGKERNDDPDKGPLIHPDMKPWSKLNNSNKQKDIDTAQNIIPLLTSVGLRVYRTV